jgi:undecaprenyl-diphosphatase
MPRTGISALFEQLDDYELALCLRVNRACRIRPVERFFGAVSRLGDGLFWYALMALLPGLLGPDALAVSARMALTGALGVLLYKVLKDRTVRPRPLAAHAGIQSAVAPLDRYSFPSGHTLHAVAFTVVAVEAYPVLGWLLVPFAALVALSRVLLGLHYPSDVLAGAVLGAAIGYLGTTL